MQHSSKSRTVLSESDCVCEGCVSALQSSAYIESARRSAYPAKA